ncbi:MAG TPA: ribonuclease P protein component [Terriglobales bacterium]
MSAYLSGPIQREKFPRSARLLRHADFEQVYKRGKRHFSALMTVFFLTREQDGGMRVGFTVGKVLGGAAVRNRMKRRLREAVRLEGFRPIEVDVVINPKKSLLDAEFSVVRKEVGRAFQVIEQKLSEKRNT